MLDQTKLFFRWVLPISVIGSLCGLIWFNIDSKTQLNELEKRNGTIIESELFDDERDGHFIIYLNNGDFIFLNSNWFEKFNILEEKALPSNGVEYYCKPNEEGKIDPYQLKIEDNLLIELSEEHYDSIVIAYFMGWWFVLGLLGMILRGCYMKRQDGNITCGLIKALNFKTRC